MMDPTKAIFGPQEIQPAKLKVYAPNGDTKEVVAYLNLRAHQEHCHLVELFLQYEDGTIEVLSKKVVVKNMETGEVCYNPRAAPKMIGNHVLISYPIGLWLHKNPHWPAILELWDNPVENGEKETDGLNP